MDMHRLLSAIHGISAPCVLATVIGVVGHAYRKRGSAMLLAAEGTKHGSISPGCLENDLQERVMDVWDSGLAQVVSYNMQPDEDAVWGEALGCGGKIDVLLEPVTGELRACLNDARASLDARQSIRFRRRFSAGRVEYSIEPLPAGETAAPEPDSASEADGMELTFDWHPEPRLIVFGAGEDAVPIAALAARSGFAVTVADWRPGLCAADRFPDAEVAVGSLEALGGSLGLTSGDYVVICSHQLERDRGFLELALAADAAYIGIMGSRKRIAMLLGDRPKPASVHAPIGLSIGAEGAEEIAVSVTAELIAVHRKARGAGKKGVEPNEAVRYLFGGGKQQKDGPSEAADGAVGRGQPGRLGASCSIG